MAKWPCQKSVIFSSEWGGSVDHPGHPPTSQVLHFADKFFPKELARHLLFFRGDAASFTCARNSSWSSGVAQVGGGIISGGALINESTAFSGPNAKILRISDGISAKSGAHHEVSGGVEIPSIGGDRR